MTTGEQQIEETAAENSAVPANPVEVTTPDDATPAEVADDASADQTDSTSPADEAAGKTAEEVKEGEGDVDDDTVYRSGMGWFVLRVASNKESYVKATLLRKVQIEDLESQVGRILVPTEKTKSLKGGKQRIVETKLYPGYVFVEMKLEDDGRIPQDVFFLIKETTGVGDFVGTAGRPAPMKAHEAEKMLHDAKPPEESPQVKMEFQKGDVVMITEGPFESHEGTVDEVYPDKGIVKVLVTIFGRQVPVEVEYWIIAPIDD